MLNVNEVTPDDSGKLMELFLKLKYVNFLKDKLVCTSGKHSCFQNEFHR